MLKSFAVTTVCIGLFAGWCSTGICAGQTYLTGQAARAVIGQTTFDGQTPGTTNTNFGGIGGLAYANNTLFATDANRLGLLPNNNRILIFDNIQQQLPADNAEIAPYTGRCPVCGGIASLVLGQPDFITAAQITPPTQTSLRTPTAVASDGQNVAVADTANNRILIWRSIPTVNGQPADIVLGQPNFSTVGRNVVAANTLRGPQGVWLQNGKLFVADTQNNRILIWNSVPTQNNQSPDLVLGQPNFVSAPPINQTSTTLPTTANIMLSPVSVSSDGTHLFVADLGYNRVLIWNQIPTQTQQPADVEIGQLNFQNSIANDATELCASTGTDSSGNPIYPALCAATMNFPRYVLADSAGRLYVADGGNDRVLVYNTIPTQNAARADAILGEPDEFSDVYTNADTNITSAANSTPTPTSLAWDGHNLYVADSTNYRILVFTPEQPLVPISNVVNAASLAVYATGSVTVGGTIAAKDVATITINGTAYNYTVLSTDTTDTVAKGLVAVIDAANKGLGDPSVFVYEKDTLSTILLVARQPGPGSATSNPLTGNNITLATSVNTSSQLTLSSSGGTLTGGGSAGQLAPGTILFVNGTNLADSSASAAASADQLPFTLAGVELYIDGQRAPLFSVSPTQIKAVLPWSVFGSATASSWLRIMHADGSVTVTDAVNIPVVTSNPGIFADTTAGAKEPRAATAVHASSYATGTIVVGGTTQAGDTGVITIGSNSYSYTVSSSDTLASIEVSLINLINANASSQVVASVANEGYTIRLQAKVPGPAGDGISISTGTSTLATNTGGVLLSLSATNTQMCCASVAGTLITPSNPAVPGETIVIYATGLGLITPDSARITLIGRDGNPYNGPPANTPVDTVSSSAGTASGTIISASLEVGFIGIYQVVIELGNAVPADAQAQLTISQGFHTSNIVTIPVGVAPQLFRATVPHRGGSPRRAVPAGQ
jgi:uncharacterized protein (TIGR03437 family)